MFVSFVDRRVLELLPEITNLPHIHVDPVMLVIYYSIMYHGCSLRASNITSHESLAYMNASYLGCLRAVPSWEREASGTMTDVIAALYTVSLDYPRSLYTTFSHVLRVAWLLSSSTTISPGDPSNTPANIVKFSTYIN